MCWTAKFEFKSAFVNTGLHSEAFFLNTSRVHHGFTSNLIRTPQQRSSSGLTYHTFLIFEIWHWKVLKSYNLIFRIETSYGFHPIRIHECAFRCPECTRQMNPSPICRFFQSTTSMTTQNANVSITCGDTRFRTCDYSSAAVIGMSGSNRFLSCVFFLVWHMNEWVLIPLEWQTNITTLRTPAAHPLRLSQWEHWDLVTLNTVAHGVNLMFFFNKKRVKVVWNVIGIGSEQIV